MEGDIIEHSDFCLGIRQEEFKKVVVKSRDEVFKDRVLARKPLLEEVIFEDSIESLDGIDLDKAFHLKKVRLPKGITKIPPYFFRSCSRLEEVKLPETVTEIGEEAFHSSGIRKLILPKGVKKIGKLSFYASKLGEIVLPEGLTTIEDMAFLCANWLWKLTLPSTVLEIGDEAFIGCNHLDKLFIPKNVKKLGENFFDKFNRIEIEKENPYYEKQAEAIYTKDGKRLLKYFIKDRTRDVILPDMVEKIDKFAFMYAQFRKLIINSKLKKISDRCFFGAECDTIVLHEDMEELGYEAFRCMEAKEFTFPKQIKGMTDGLFDSSKIGKMIFHDEIEKIGKNVFGGADCEEIKLPAKVKEIGDRAFSEMKSLIRVVIPDKVEKLGNNCFSHCEKLSYVKLPKNLKIIGKECFMNCKSLTALVLPESLERIEEMAFLCAGIKELTIPKTVEWIGDKALDGLEKVCLYDNVKYISSSKEVSLLSGCYYTDSYDNPIFITLKSAETEEVIYKLYFVPIMNYLEQI